MSDQQVVSRRGHGRLGRAGSWLAARSEPRPDGLPNPWVLLSFPVAVIVAMGTLVLLSISGSSTGQWWIRLGRGDDPHLLAGTSRPIRSDEWLAQSSWIVSQVAQGLPSRNRVFPGGMDATVFNDLPSHDWSTAFRPHLWGFFASLDQGMALRWWLPGALVLIFAYCFVVSLLPRSGVLAAVLALTAFFQPTIQWWYMPVTLLPIAFAFAAMTAVVWAVRSTRLAGRVVSAALAGYLAVTMAMSIYVPFMIAAIVPAVAFAAGFLVHAWRTESMPLGELGRRLVPLASAGVAAGVVMALWAVTRRDTVEAVLGTVYPGQRLTATGIGNEAHLVDLLSGPFQRSLQLDVIGGLSGGNQSEDATTVLVCLFLVPALVWVLVAQRRRGLGPDWLAAALLAVQAIVLAYIFLPKWDAVAHLLLLDRSTPARMRPTFLILGVVTVAVLLDRLRRLGRTSWPVAVAGGALVLASSGFVWRELRQADSPIVPSTYAVVLTSAIAVAVVLLARRRALPGAVLLLGCAIVIGAGVNPLYRGVVDLGHDSAAGREVTRLAGADPSGRWVGVGSALSMATVVETGVPGYSGVQTYPSTAMWKQIDPSGKADQVWNRLAHVSWVDGRGKPAPRLTAPDQIQLTFDSCAAFAQQHVAYALVDGAPLDQSCVDEVAHFVHGSTRQWIYKVVPGPDSTS